MSNQPRQSCLRPAALLTVAGAMLLTLPAGCRTGEDQHPGISPQRQQQFEDAYWRDVHWRHRQEIKRRMQK